MLPSELMEVGRRATRPEALLEGWLEVLSTRGATGLALRLGEHDWTIGRTRGAHVELGEAWRVYGPLKLGGREHVGLAALGDLVATWHRRLERFSVTSRHAASDRLRLREEVRTLTARDAGLLGESPAMQRAWELLRSVAPHETTVLLLGETGTGKELAARALHRLAACKGPFLALNCGALGGGVLESELFGHARGAFTGAEKARQGLLRAASGGTLFLDEIAELSLDGQARLLRALQERRVRPVGAERDVPFSTRIVAATHRELQARVRAGTFREDLYYRLAVFPIRLPPLRERPSDIPEIVRSTVAQLALRQRREPPTIDRATMSALVAHRWSGNVRELRNELERALLMSGDRLRWHPPRAVGVREAETFDAGVRRILQDALEHCDGRVYGPRGAAARLGLPPSTLQTKMKKLGVERVPSD